MALVVKYGTDLDIVKEVERFRTLSKTEREHAANKRQRPNGREAASIESKRRFGNGGDGGPGSQWDNGQAKQRARTTWDEHRLTHKRRHSMRGCGTPHGIVTTSTIRTSMRSPNGSKSIRHMRVGTGNSTVGTGHSTRTINTMRLAGDGTKTNNMRGGRKASTCAEEPH